MRAPDALGIREAGYAPDPHDYGLDIDGSRHAEYEADWYRWRAVRRAWGYRRTAREHLRGALGGGSR